MAAILAFFLGCTCPDAGPRLEVDPAVLELDDTAVGQSSSGWIRLLNVGTDTLHVAGVTLAPDAPGAFLLPSPDTADLFPGAGSRVQVRFAPRSPGFFRTNVEVLSDDPIHPLQRVALLAQALGDPDVPDVPDEQGPDADGDGVSPADGDCDDTSPEISPGAAEVCDGRDDDCDGEIPSDELDADGDGASVCDGDCDDADASAHLVHADAAAPAPGDGTIEAPYPTLASALAHLDTKCHTVVLAPGAYDAAVRLDSATVTVRGATGDASDVTLTPTPGARAFDVRGGRVTLEALALTGAKIQGSGGALRASEAEVTLDGVDVTDNSASERGGGVAVRGGTLTVRGGSFSGNHADAGGAVDAEDSTVEIGRSVFFDNEAAHDGGALRLEATGGAVHNARLIGNTAGRDGGAVRVLGGELLVVNDTFVENASGGDGAAIAIDGHDGLYVWSNIVAWSKGATAIAASGGSVAYNLVWGGDTTLDLGGADDGANVLADPHFVRYTPGDPGSNLTPGPGSPAIDSGPPEGTGPAGHRWADVDGTPNDRGYTGGGDVTRRSTPR